MQQTLAVALAYLVGSIPFAFLVARRSGVDLRARGSHNVGASNVLRTAGVGSAVTAMCLDGVKGALAVLIAFRLSNGMALPVAAGLASVVGHIYPVWLGFRGGKGVATAAGVFAVLAPVALGLAGAVFVITVWLTRYVSLGSMTAAAALAVATMTWEHQQAVTIGAMSAAGLILLRHKDNVARLRTGTERRIGLRGV
ncbi:MAG: glycerol-3-phosphate 1-O-acyltransferase PlsY [Vicinamibacterales bacterium]